MSISINGIYFNCSDIDGALDIIEEIKPHLIQKIHQIYLEDISTQILYDFAEIFVNNRQVNKLDGVTQERFGKNLTEDIQVIEKMNLIDLHSFKFKDEIIKEPNKREAQYEFKNYINTIYFFKQTITKLAPKYLGIIHSNASEVQDIILNHPLIKDYSYYNSHDGQVEEIGYKNWRRRGRNWEKILPSYNIEKEKLFTIEITKNKDIVYSPDNENKIIDYIKQNYQCLITQITDKQTVSHSLNQYMRELNIDPEDIQGFHKHFNMSDFFTLEKINKEYRKNNTYRPETKKEEILLTCYQKAKDEIQIKTKILFEKNIDELLQKPIKEIITIREKINLENNQDNDIKYIRKKL